MTNLVGSMAPALSDAFVATFGALDEAHQEDTERLAPPTRGSGGGGRPASAPDSAMADNDDGAL